MESEDKATKDLRERGVFRMAPGLWCDSTRPDLISVIPDCDNAVSVRRALCIAGQLPDVRTEE